MSLRQFCHGSTGRPCAILVALVLAMRVSATAWADTPLSQTGPPTGIFVVLGLPIADDPGSAVALAKSSGVKIYFQSPHAKEVAAVRAAALEQELLGKRVFVVQADLQSLHLADNLADFAIVSAELAKAGSVAEKELLRVLRPQAKAVLVDDKIIEKPLPDGIDDWSHPYHGPDNNPQSTDQFAKAPYLTQFLAAPKFSPMPEVTVAAGGRIFKAMGHIAHKSNQNPWLNTLLGINAYNGTILWRRPLKEGFMVHRNTMIATPDYLYLADDESCKKIDAATGEVADEIRLPAGLAEGPVWKWMALQGGVLYALVGDKENPISTKPSRNPGLGHWPWGMWEGHDYNDPKTSFGFGRTLVALDPETKKVIWSHRADDYIDSRGLCMNEDRLFLYFPDKSLHCLNASTGDAVWQTSEKDLLDAIGPNQRAQHYVTGYSTTTYIKCNKDYLFFAGPQRSRLVVASAKDGSLLWHKEHGNLQLVLRDDGFYAAGPAQTGRKLAYEDGAVLAQLPTRRACTRATGTLDSVFYRTPGGTVRIETATNTAKHIAPMRPPCQDGVIVSNGMLYWGPWMCGCQLSFYGNIGLASAGSFDFAPAPDASRLEPGTGAAAVKSLAVQPGDWPTYGSDNRRSMSAGVPVPKSAERQWTAEVSPGVIPSAPVTAGGLVFLGSRNGTVQALDATSGDVRWRAHTGGAIYFPPAIWEGRAYVGSADGYVYAFEAATGRPLWRFRAAPADRLISVYDRLCSTWPVAGGVVVQDGTVYAAAGIAHYDGTHVFALDATTGKVKWYNGSSGTHSNTDSGVSLQGSLYIRGGELRFIGGGVHETARYDLATGKCLNAPHHSPNSTFQTAFYAYYPAYGGYLSLDYTFDDGKTLEYDASYEGAAHSNLALLPAGTPRPAKPESRWGYLRRRRDQQQTVWKDRSASRFCGFAVTKDALLAAGDQPTDGAHRAFLAAIRVDDGQDIWREKLPAKPVKGGLAVNSGGQIFVSLENGQLVCFREGS